MKFKDKLKYTLYLRYFGLTRIPLILFVRPSIVDTDQNKVVVKIPFRRRTKNHLNSMYFGAMSIGADLAAGFLAFMKIKGQNKSISLIFKNFNAEFLKRAEGDTLFICNDGIKINNLINRAIVTEERVEEEINVTATVPSEFSDEPVAHFKLTLSLKKR